MKPTDTDWSMPSDIKRILIVDDEPEFVKTIQRHLRRKGFSICSAFDGKMARDRIEESIAEGVPFQLVITDVLMPRMDGVELMKWIDESHPEISVLAVSGFADPILAENIIRSDRDEYCQKPFTPDKMMALLGSIEKKRRKIVSREA